MYVLIILYFQDVSQRRMVGENVNTILIPTHTQFKATSFAVVCFLFQFSIILHKNASLGIKGNVRAKRD